MKKLISFVIPCHNEAANIIPLFNAIVQAIPSKFEKEIIFIDDGSKDAIRSKMYDQDRNYYLAQYYFDVHNYEKSKFHTFTFINQAGTDERVAELRYYFTNSKLEQNQTELYLHEVYVINAVHEGSNWAELVNEEYKLWLEKNPEYKEIDLEDYK